MKIKSLLLSTAAAASLFVLGTTAANADTVTVKAGDTVSALADTYNTTISAIEKANSLADVNLIIVGQQLEVNGTTTQAVATPASQAPAQSQAPASQAPAQSQAPVQSQTPVQSQAPAQSQAASAAPAATTASAPVQSQAPAATTNDSDSSAKAWIANKESGGSYSATNGRYIGKYQLDSSYLNGDYSAANQERVANNYVSSRYGSWAAAQSFWQANGWY
ncbi:LysM peptidoglycan-binding domain-containing protein [Lactiplantibacillus nangangensis]|uniref:LysM peptidoglycan-binding domain-containing protein n=1 Tax=Lactiplantibacillus nangangensis TaxID=2559917 RepID=A0ABW1SJU3_9LACO|nr:LysM peptidoglycan-binding domain-containing protein [Lactiplantibacillus nangangensis]